MKKNISNKIGYMYFILTVGMVMYHSRWLYIYNFKKKCIIDEKLLSLYFRFANHIGTVCMVFFFFMSAFWFYRDLDSWKKLLIKYKKKIKTLVVPYILWTIIVLIYNYFAFGFVLNVEKMIYYLFENPIVGPLWYILALIILQLFAPLVMLIKNNKRVTEVI